MNPTVALIADALAAAFTLTMDVLQRPRARAMTAPVLAPIVARIDSLEAAMVLLREVLNRQIGDTVALNDALRTVASDVRELRALVRGAS